MTTEKIEEEMIKRGYTVFTENHIIYFTGKYPYIEDMEKEIADILSELGYEGSWGTKGISKKSRKTPKPSTNITPTADPAASAIEEPAPTQKDLPKEDPVPVKDDTPPIKEDTPKADQLKKPRKKDTGTPEFNQLSLMDFFTS